MNHKIAIIVGSTRPGRVGRAVADWYFSHVKDTPNVDFQIVDLADINLPLLDEAIPPSMHKYQNEHTKKWAELVNGFDAFVWVTAEYNHSAPASLTNAISFVFQEWNRKPVALVSYGSMGGVRAAEHLRQVAGELQMVDIRPAVMLMEPWAMFDETGVMKPEHIKGAPIPAQVEELVWWTDAIKAKQASEQSPAS